MGTRALLTFKDQYATVHVYRHWDGYPEGVLPDLQAVANSDKVWPLPRFEADEFSSGVIAALKDSPGNYRLSNGPDAHGDVEYWYTVTGEKGGICVNWNGHGKTGQQLIKRKVK